MGVCGGLGFGGCLWGFELGGCLWGSVLVDICGGFKNALEI